MTEAGWDSGSEGKDSAPCQNLFPEPCCLLYDRQWRAPGPPEEPQDEALGCGHSSTRLLSLCEWAWQRQHGGGAEPARPALSRPLQGRRTHRSGTLLSCGAHDHDHDHAACSGHAHAHVDPDDVRLNVSASEAQGVPGVLPYARSAREGAARH